MWKAQSIDLLPGVLTDDRNATALEEDSDGRPSLAQTFGPEAKLPTMPTVIERYTGQGGRVVGWQGWNSSDPAPILGLSALMAAQSTPQTDGASLLHWFAPVFTWTHLSPVVQYCTQSYAVETVLVLRQACSDLQ